MSRERNRGNVNANQQQDTSVKVFSATEWASMKSVGFAGGDGTRGNLLGDFNRIPTSEIILEQSKGKDSSKKFGAYAFSQEADEEYWCSINELIREGAIVEDSDGGARIMPGEIERVDGRITYYS